MPFEMTEALNTFLAVMSFVLGAMIGSFLNVCVYRLPRGLSVVRPRSRCPKCEKSIAWSAAARISACTSLGKHDPP